MGKALQSVKSIHMTDFETYWSPDFSLKKKDLSTSLYVSDPRFEVIGVGVSVDGAEPIWMEAEEYRNYVAQVDWSVTAFAAHHAHFDAYIAALHFGVNPVFYFDTLSLARPHVGVDAGGSLHKLAEMFKLGHKGDDVKYTRGKRRANFTTEQWAKFGEYCKNDVRLQNKLLEIFLASAQEDELELIDTTIRMFAHPTLKLDVGYALEYMKRLADSKAALVERIGSNIATLMSADKFADLLLEHGIIPGTKISPRTGLETWAFSKTDPFMQELVSEDNPNEMGRFIGEARLGIKSTGAATRAARFVRTADQNDGYLPVYLKYAGAHTYRWSGGDGTNYQNLTRTDKNFDPNSYDTKGALRWSIVAPDGCVLFVWDLSQIEARVLAWLSGHENLVASFAAGEDVYSKFASIAYGRKVDPEVNPADKEARFVGKICVLGLGYGMGAIKLGQTLLSGQQGPKVVLTAKVADELGVNVDNVVPKLRFGKLAGDDALAAVPSLLTQEERRPHFAVADYLVGQYRKANKPITELWDAMETVIENMAEGREETFGPVATVKNGLVLPNGLTLHYPNLHWSDEAKSWHYQGRNPWPIKLYGGMFTENVVQALARCIIGWQMLQLKEQDFHIATMTHDEVVCVDVEEGAEERNKIMEQIMKSAPPWATGIPLSAEGGYGKRYGEVK